MFRNARKKVKVLNQVNDVISNETCSGSKYKKQRYNSRLLLLTICNVYTIYKITKLISFYFRVFIDLEEVSRISSTVFSVHFRFQCNITLFFEFWFGHCYVSACTFFFTGQWVNRLKAAQSPF